MSLRSHVEKAEMLMVLTAEPPGFVLRNFTKSVQLLFFQPLHVNGVQFKQLLDFKTCFAVKQLVHLVLFCSKKA